MPTVAVGSDFLEAYARLPRAQQKKVREFTEKFKANPKSSAINYEKIHDVKDDKVRTVRIDQKYRAVVLQPDTGDVYVLAWVDNHDEAMAWARKRTFEINPHTGALQVINVTEAEQSVGADTGKKPRGLFASHDDGVLLSFGLPAVLLPAVRAVQRRDDLLALGKHLPAEASEALTWLAEGMPPEEVRDAVESATAKGVNTADLAKALDHPDTKRRFVTIRSDNDLAAILDAPLAKWRVFLHPSQEKLARKQFNGPARVLGGAGTGKTVVAMHRARHLAGQVFTAPQDRVLFTTFTANQVLCHGAEGVQPRGLLGTHRLRTRRLAGQGQLPQQVLGQRQRRHWRQRPAVQRDFLPGVPHLGPQVEAMDVHELLADFQPQPQEEGQARVGAVLGELAAHGQVGLLDDVGGIDAALEPSVHAQPDLALQLVPVTLDQDGQGALVAGSGGGQ
jgi:hypothetical protein